MIKWLGILILLYTFVGRYELQAQVTDVKMFSSIENDPKRPKIEETLSLKLWIPPGEHKYQLQLNAPEGWHTSYPKHFHAKPNGASFVFARITPDIFTKAGQYPIELTLLSDQGKQQNFSYLYTIHSMPELTIEELSSQHYIQEGQSQPITLSIKNSGNTPLSLTPSKGNKAFFSPDSHWPIELDVNESKEVQITVRPEEYINKKTRSQNIQLNCSFFDEKSRLIFSKNLLFSLFSEGGVDRHWVYIPSKATFVTYFNEDKIDRGVIFTGKGSLSENEENILSYEYRWRDSYQVGDSSLSGNGFIQLDNAFGGKQFALGDIQTQTGGLISRGGRDRGICVEQKTGRYRYKAYYTKDWDYTNNHSSAPKGSRVSWEYSELYPKGSYWKIYGYREKAPSDFSDALTFANLEAKRQITDAQILRADYGIQLSGKTTSTTQSQSRHGQAARLEWRYTPSSSFALFSRVEYGSPCYAGNLKDVFRTYHTLNKKYKDLSTSLQYLYSRRNLKNNRLDSAEFRQSIVGQVHLPLFTKLASSFNTKLEKSRNHLRKNNDDYRYALASLGLNWTILSTLRANIKRELEYYDYYNTGQKSWPSWNDEITLAFIPNKVLSLNTGYKNRLVASSTVQQRQRSYRWGAQINNQKDMKINLSYARSIQANSNKRSFLTKIHWKINPIWESTFSLNSSQTDEDGNSYDGKFTLTRSLDIPAYKPGAKHVLQGSLQSAKNLLEPLLLQVGPKTLKIQKTGKFTTNLPVGRHSIFFINLPKELTNAQLIKPIVVTEDRKNYELKLDLVQTANISIALSVMKNIEKNMINIEKEKKRLEDFVQNLTIYLINRIDGETLLAKIDRNLSFHFPYIRPGTWEIALPQTPITNYFFHLESPVVTVQEGETAQVKLLLKTKNRNLKILSSTEEKEVSKHLFIAGNT